MYNLSSRKGAGRTPFGHPFEARVMPDLKFMPVSAMDQGKIQKRIIHFGLKDGHTYKTQFLSSPNNSMVPSGKTK